MEIFILLRHLLVNLAFTRMYVFTNVEVIIELDYVVLHRAIDISMEVIEQCSLYCYKDELHHIRTSFPQACLWFSTSQATSRTTNRSPKRLWFKPHITCLVLACDWMPCVPLVIQVLHVFSIVNQVHFIITTVIVYIC